MKRHKRRSAVSNCFLFTPILLIYVGLLLHTALPVHSRPFEVKYTDEVVMASALKKDYAIQDSVVLEKLLMDSNPYVRIQALLALRDKPEILTRNAAVLNGMVDDPIERVQGNLLWLAGKTLSKDLLPAIRKGAHCKRSAIRSFSIALLLKHKQNLTPEQITYLWLHRFELIPFGYRLVKSVSHEFDLSDLLSADRSDQLLNAIVSGERLEDEHTYNHPVNAHRYQHKDPGIEETYRSVAEFLGKNSESLARLLNDPEFTPEPGASVYHSQTDLAIWQCLKYGSEGFRHTLFQMFTSENPLISSNAIKSCENAYFVEACPNLLTVLYQITDPEKVPPDELKGLSDQILNYLFSAGDLRVMDELFCWFTRHLNDGLEFRRAFFRRIAKSRPQRLPQLMNILLRKTKDLSVSEKLDAITVHQKERIPENVVDGSFHFLPWFIDRGVWLTNGSIGVFLTDVCRLNALSKTRYKDSDFRFQQIERSGGNFMVWNDSMEIMTDSPYRSKDLDGLLTSDWFDFPHLIQINQARKSAAHATFYACIGKYDDHDDLFSPFILDALLELLIYREDDCLEEIHRLAVSNHARAMQLSNWFSSGKPRLLLNYRPELKARLRFLIDHIVEEYRNTPMEPLGKDRFWGRKVNAYRDHFGGLFVLFADGNVSPTRLPDGLMIREFHVRQPRADNLYKNNINDLDLKSMNVMSHTSQGSVEQRAGPELLIGLIDLEFRSAEKKTREIHFHATFKDRMGKMVATLPLQTVTLNSRKGQFPLVSQDLASIQLPMMPPVNQLPCTQDTYTVFLEAKLGSAIATASAELWYRGKPHILLMPPTMAHSYQTNSRLMKPAKVFQPRENIVVEFRPMNLVDHDLLCSAEVQIFDNKGNPCSQPAAMEFSLPSRMDEDLIFPYCKIEHRCFGSMYQSRQPPTLPVTGLFSEITLPDSRVEKTYQLLLNVQCEGVDYPRVIPFVIRPRTGIRIDDLSVKQDRNGNFVVKMDFPRNCLAVSAVAETYGAVIVTDSGASREVMLNSNGELTIQPLGTEPSQLIIQGGHSHILQSIDRELLNDKRNLEHSYYLGYRYDLRDPKKIDAWDNPIWAVMTLPGLKSVNAPHGR